MLMSKKIQLSIAEPCHENWENMSPVDKGKFCGSCQKQVVDFSMKNDRQIAEFFKKPTTGSVCGRFMTDQLEREIEIPKRRIPWVKYFFQLALPAFFISKASAQNIKMGKMANPGTMDTSRISINKEIRTLGLVMPTTFIKSVCTDTTAIAIQGEIEVVENNPVNGKVLNEMGVPVSDATITIKGTKIGVVVTKEDGSFTIMPESNLEKIVLVVSCIGFETKEVVVERKNYLQDQIINIGITNINYEIMGAVVVVGMANKKIKPIPVIPAIIKDADFKSLKIFPNPVISGTSLAIEWTQKEEGYYSSQILNQSGQVIHRQEIWIDAEAGILSFDVPFISSGNYFLLITSKKSGKKFSEKIIIQ